RVEVDGVGCFAVAPVTLMVDTTPVVTIDPIADVCEEDEISFVITTNQASGVFSIAPAAAPGSFTDNTDGTATVDPTDLAPGTYTVTFSYEDDQTCVGAASTSFTVLDRPDATITVSENSGTTANDSTICIGDAVGLIATGGATYEWLDDGSTNSVRVVTPTTDSLFRVVVFAANGCSDTTGVLIEVNDLPVVEITNTIDTFCLNEAAVTLMANVTGGVFAGPGVSQPTANGPYEFDPATAGVGTHTITLDYIDAEGCAAVQVSKDFEVLPVPTGASIALSDNIICIGTTADLTFVAGAAPGPYMVVVDTGAADLTYTGVNDGDVLAAFGSAMAETLTFELVSVTSDNTCEAVYSGNALTLMIQDDAVMAEAGPDTLICTGQTYTVVGASFVGDAIMWSTSGDGSFDDATSVAPTYTPGANDQLSGSVTLTLTANGAGACAGQVATDDMVLTVSPQANAGEPFPAYTEDTGNPPAVDFCLSVITVDLFSLLNGSPDLGGTFTIEQADAPGAVIGGNGVLNVGSVASGSGNVLGFEVKYKVGTAPCADSTNIFIYFDDAPTAGVDPPTAFVCSDFGLFDLDTLLSAAGASPGGTWTVQTPNIGVTTSDLTSENEFDTRDVLYIPGGTGTTNPISRILTFRYEVNTGTSASACSNMMIEARVQVNQAGFSAIATVDGEDTYCFDTPAIAVTGTIRGAATSGSWFVDPGNGGAGIPLTNPMIQDDSIFTATFEPMMSDWGTDVTLLFVTNDVDGPAGTGTFPFIEGICAPDTNRLIVSILDKPDVVASPMGDTTICSGELPGISLATTVTFQPVRFVRTVTSTSTDISGYSTTTDTLEPGDLLQDTPLMNTGAAAGAVTYTLTPIDGGPDGDFTTNADNCTGDDLVIEVTVQPEPIVRI
ncbi:MAG: hypothetical protein AAFN92_08090, partial [Bacteroidota bacterium]